MATMLQAPLTAPDSGAELIIEPIYEMNALVASDLQSTSTDMGIILGQPLGVSVGKEEELTNITTVEISSSDDGEEATQEDGSLSRTEAIQILVDGEKDIQDAVQVATELAILEDLVDMEPQPAVVTTYQDNVVFMNTDRQYRLRSATYEVEDLSMPEGQDPCNICHVGMSQRYTGNEGNLEFLCGRNPSTEVAQWWNERITSSSSRKDPTALNFAFTGTLSLTIFGESLLEGADRLVLPDFGIAQGYSGKDLTWLFGSTDEQTAEEVSEEDTLRFPGYSTSWGNLVNAYFRRGKGVTDQVELIRIEYLW